MNTVSSAAKQFYFNFSLSYYFSAGYFCCGKMNRVPNS